jgi:hypothetical protein
MSIMKDFPAGNPALWQKLLSLSESNARALLNNLCSLFFIRENYTLHDELIRLIRQYLWKKMEPLRTYILPLGSTGKANMAPGFVSILQNIAESGL